MALDYAKSLGIFEKKKDKSRSTGYTRRVDRAPRCTTLIDAAYWGKYDECRSLVQSGVDPDIKTEYGGWTAVMLAAESGHKNIVQLLCEAGARVNIRDDHGASALDIAAEEKQYPTCRYLIHAGLTTADPRMPSLS